MPVPTETSELALTQLNCLLVIRRPTNLSVGGNTRILLKTISDRRRASAMLSVVSRHRNRLLRLPCRLRNARPNLVLICAKLTRVHDLHLPPVNLLVIADPFMWWVFLTSTVASLLVFPYVSSSLHVPSWNTNIFRPYALKAPLHYQTVYSQGPTPGANIFPRASNTARYMRGEVCASTG